LALEWVFDGVPPSGARLGGDPSAFVFKASIETFVREVLQNSADQGVSDDRVDVDFRLLELSGADAAAFREALGWPALKRHLQGVRASRGPTEQGRFAEPKAVEEVLRVLWIEDRNTTGLDGPESGDGTYAALCRDRLFSHKGVASGGSFGLGKAVLWRFSAVSVVAFHSSPKGQPSRFIAKAALPWHRVGGQQFAGDGWLGKSENTGPLRRAVSVRGQEADGAAGRLGLPEWAAGVTGTRIGVVAFHDPASDDEADVPTLCARIDAAAERNFWPAMVMARLRVGVAPMVPPRGHAPWRALFEAYTEGEERESLVSEGDVVVVPLPLDVPGRKGRGLPIEAEVDLVVRLSGARAPDVSELIAFRGAGMVVERRRRERLSSSARPFHALLVAGMARRDVGPNDAEVEQFLRAAEPPSHDRWVSTPRLQQGWKRGYAKAVQSMWQRAEEQLRRIVSTPIDQLDEGPEGLRRLFPLSGEGGGRSTSAFRFRDLEAQLVDGRWQFAGAVEPSEPTAEPWQVVVSARVPDELGTQIPVAQVTAEGGEVVVEAGRGFIRAGAGQPHVVFRGRTTRDFPVDPARSTFELVVNGGGLAG